jgi:HEAT repeat protein
MWKLVLLLSISLIAAESDYLRAIRAAEVIGDRQGVLRQVERGLAQHPDSRELRVAQVEGLAAAGQEREAIAALKKLQESSPEESFADLTEKVAWGVIHRGFNEGSALHQLFGLVAGAVARDIQAVELLTSAMRSSSAQLRAAAAQLAGQMQDAPLAREVERLVLEEHVWQVRVEAIRSAGRLHIAKLRPRLEAIAANEGVPAEERQAAIVAIAELLETMPRSELQALASSQKAGLRQLACQVVAQLDLLDDFDLIAPLVDDPRPDVRGMAMLAAGLLRVDSVEPQLDDPDPGVAITAAWLATLQEKPEGLESLRRWLEHPHPQSARRAAAAIRSAGRYGVALAEEWVELHPDPYVRATLAQGLIGQRKGVAEASEALHEVCRSEKSRWMWEDAGHPVLRHLAPSQVRFDGRVPNHPEVVNQLTRLEVLSNLAVVDHQGAVQAIHSFLQERAWGISGLASVMLLEEGDEAALEAVRTLLDDPDQKIRVQAALALAGWGKDPSAVEVLEEAYSGADRDLKIKILESIGRVGARRSLPFLIETLDEPFASLRIIAAASMIQCLNS